MYQETLRKIIKKNLPRSLKICLIL